MNSKKLQRLFAAARNELPLAPPADFAADVLRAVRQEPTPAPAGPISLWEHLDRLFPRVALAAAVIIVLCVAVDWGLGAAGLPEVGDGVAQVSSQYLFNSEGL